MGDSEAGMMCGSNELEGTNYIPMGSPEQQQQQMDDPFFTFSAQENLQNAAACMELCVGHEWCTCATYDGLSGACMHFQGESSTYGEAGEIWSSRKNSGGFALPNWPRDMSTAMGSGLFDTYCTGDITPCQQDGSKNSGQFYQDIRGKALTIFSTTNIGDADWSFKVQNTEGSGITQSEMSTGNAKGYLVSNCGPSRTSNSMNHLFIVDSDKSPNASVTSSTAGSGSQNCRPFTLPMAYGLTHSVRQPCLLLTVLSTISSICQIFVHHSS